jgi:hypothetical protein
MQLLSAHGVLRAPATAADMQLGLDRLLGTVFEQLGCAPYLCALASMDPSNRGHFHMSAT